MKASSTLSCATASHDAESLVLEVSGLTTCKVDGAKAAPELPDGAYCGHKENQNLKDYKAKKRSKDSDLFYPPGVEHVSGSMIRTALSSLDDVNRHFKLSIEPKGESMYSCSIAILVDPSPVTTETSDAEPREVNHRGDSEIKAVNQPRSRKLLWTGALIFEVIVVILIVAAILPQSLITATMKSCSHKKSRDWNATLNALMPFLPESSKQAIGIQGTPQYQAFQWLNGTVGVETLPDYRIIRRYALATLFYATNGLGWKTSTGWLTDDNECNWYSVRLGIDNSDELTALFFGSNNLIGSLPMDIGMLTSLTSLDLILSDFVRTDLNGSIPSSIGQLTSLNSLSLSGNALTGTIPSSLGQLTSLTHLSLGSSHLTGPIPSSLGQLTSLVLFDLSINKLTGSIPSSLCQMTSLRYLDSSSNTLTGTIPSSLDQITSLYYLSLSDNALTGTIPSSLGQLTNLDYLFFSNNKLAGTIPSSLGQRTSLRSLFLYNNALTGTIPASLGQLTSLIYLRLHGNALTGTIPSFLCQLESLTGLFLDGNVLTGTIPSSFGQLTNLYDVDLSNNTLTETIPFLNSPPLQVDCDSVICGCCACP